jgi:hypothetical protein
MDNYVAYRRKNKYTWQGQSFINNFNITKIIQNKNESSFISNKLE